MAKKKAKKAAALTALKKENRRECGSCDSCGGGCSGPNGGTHDILNGIYISYDPETGLYIESNYDNGVLNGEYLEYFDLENEFIKVRGNYGHGLKEGQWIFYNKDGSADRVESYAKGRKKN